MREERLPGPFVGIDVVDTGAARCRGKASNDRFLARVFTGEEGKRIREADDPDRVLWLHWAAKEAAFKVVSRMLGGPPVFRHAGFEVFPEDAGVERADRTEGSAATVARMTAAGGGQEPVRDLLDIAGPLPWDRSGLPLAGVVRHDDRRVFFRGGTRGDLVVVVAGLPDEEAGELTLLAEVEEAGAQGTGRDPRGGLTRAERENLASAGSALVREGAKGAAARLLGVAVDRIEIVTPGRAGRTPPRLLLDGSPARVALSLSHDGRFHGWALAVGAG